MSPMDTSAPRPGVPKAAVPDAPEGTPTEGESAVLGFRLLVAPAAGRVRHLPPSEFKDGAEWVSAGQAVAVIEQGSSSVTVESPVSGRLAGVLIRDGAPVLPGQPLAYVEERPAPWGTPPGRGGR
jgi:acetyl-CoA carboxylase biotin carboxyl carrier protein